MSRTYNEVHHANEQSRYEPWTYTPQAIPIRGSERKTVVCRYADTQIQGDLLITGLRPLSLTVSEKQRIRIDWIATGDVPTLEPANRLIIGESFYTIEMCGLPEHLAWNPAIPFAIVAFHNQAHRALDFEWQITGWKPF